MWAHLRAAGLVLLWGWPGGWLVSAPAQDYPVKSIRLVVPFPPGGPNDVIGRVVGQKMQDLLGQLVIIDNRAGAGGALGTDFVAKSDPDGYTIATRAPARWRSATACRTRSSTIRSRIWP
jgi:tripartite-type tricarboxylate transporter receptor subunit TctC